MPRAKLRFRMPAKLIDRPLRPTPNYIRKALYPDRPRLYNAKRMVDQSRGIPKALKPDLERAPEDPEWSEQVSKDVAQFIEDRQLIGIKMNRLEEHLLYDNPARFFAQPENVPLALRKQVYFPPPNFHVAMRRNKHLGPHYAQFYVPMTLGKMDFKDYLRHAYGVEVWGIQSYVTHAKVRRKRKLHTKGREHRGELWRLQPKKRMTVHLKEPFLWPHENFNPKEKEFEKQEYSKINKQMKERQVKEQDEAFFKTRLDLKHRQVMAEQAKDMILRKNRWAPTWSQLPESRKLLLGENTQLSVGTQLARTKSMDAEKRKENLTHYPS